MESEKLALPLLSVYSLIFGIALASKNMVLLPIMIIVLVCSFAFFPRQMNNMIMSITPRRKNEYVVVYFLKTATHIPLKFFVIPNEMGMAKIEKGNYTITKDYALPSDSIFKGRLHFLVEEGNPIPLYAKIQEVKPEKVLFKSNGHIFFEAGTGYELNDPDKDKLRTWAFSIQRALVTTWFKVLYAETKQWAFLIAMGVAVVAIASSVYEFQYIQTVTPLVQQIYQRTIIENGSMYIHQTGHP